MHFVSSGRTPSTPASANQDQSGQEPTDPPSSHLADTWVGLKRVAGSRVSRALVLALLLVVLTLVLGAAGRPHFTVVHAYYFAILLAAHWFRIPGGIVTGLVAGVGASPFIVPDSIPQGQGEMAWVYRMSFFVAVGAFAGAARMIMELRKRRVDITLKDLTATYTRTLQALVRLLEHHDEETSTHCERVAHNALCVGTRLGLAARELETLYWAGYMHDVGKLAAPAKMLLKAGALTPREYEVMKQHASIGADTIMTITPAFHEMADAIRAHHERWDGAGYPRGLRGEEIPFLGRILTVVDSFEAMTSDRPYRRAMDVDEARGILEKEAWSQFDGAIVDCFLQLLLEGLIHVEKTHGKYTASEVRAFSPEFLLGGRTDAAELLVA